MVGWVIGAVVLAFVVAGLLLSESGGSGERREGVASVFGVVLGVVLVVVLFTLIWGGGVAEFVGCVCVVLKLLNVEPVATWTWFEAFLPFVGGFVLQMTGLILREAFD